MTASSVPGDGDVLVVTLGTGPKAVGTRDGRKGNGVGSVVGVTDDDTMGSESELVDKDVGNTVESEAVGEIEDEEPLRPEAGDEVRGDTVGLGVVGEFVGETVG